MFLQLTRIDGLPIWINASFVVTVEPSRNGGSIVVPIGDGLDYDVREAPETVLALLKEAPPAKVVPVRPPKSLTPTPDDVSPDRGYDVLSYAAPAKKTEGDDAPAAAEAKKPAAKRGRGRRSKKADSAKEKASAEQAAESAAAPPPTPPQIDVSPEGFDEIVADLKARKCRTAKRMRNAIKSYYFGKTNDVEIDRIIETMMNRGLMLIGADGHITWSDQS